MKVYGEYSLSLDDKYRMRVPSRIKEKFEGKPYAVTGAPGGCLYLCLEEDLDRLFFSKFNEAAPSDLEARALQRQFAKTVYLPSEDEQGRFVLPANSRAMAGIQKKMVFIGIGEMVEIWSDVRYNDQADDMDLVEVFKKLGL